MFELNLPNVLTVVRILLVPVLVAALLAATARGDLLAAVVFVVASVTDALDGWIARRRKSESTFGKLMDPLADKLLVVAALVSLVSLDRLSAWVAMVIIAREFAVTGLRQLAMEEGHVIPASIWGKLKTVTQIAMVLVLIAVDERTAWVDAPDLCDRFRDRCLGGGLLLQLPLTAADAPVSRTSNLTWTNVRWKWPEYEHDRLRIACYKPGHGLYRPRH